MSCQEEGRRDLVTKQKTIVALKETFKIKSGSSKMRELE